MEIAISVFNYVREVIVNQGSFLNGLFKSDSAENYLEYLKGLIPREESKAILTQEEQNAIYTLLALSTLTLLTTYVFKPYAQNSVRKLFAHSLPSLTFSAILTVLVFSPVTSKHPLFEKSLSAAKPLPSNNS